MLMYCSNYHYYYYGSQGTRRCPTVLLHPPHLAILQFPVSAQQSDTEGLMSWCWDATEQTFDLNKKIAIVPDQCSQISLFCLAFPRRWERLCRLRSHWHLSFFCMCMEPLTCNSSDSNDLPNSTKILCFVLLFEGQYLHEICVAFKLTTTNYQSYVQVVWKSWQDTDASSL